MTAGACGGRWECSEWVRGRRRGCLSGPICIDPHDQHPRNLDPWISLPRHPRPNFTEIRVRSRALARLRTSRNELCRASRPKNTEAFGKLVSVTNKRLTIQAQTHARAQAVIGSRAVLHDAQIHASMFFATQARHSEETGIPYGYPGEKVLILF